MSIRAILSALSGMPEARIRDTMTVRCDLGLRPFEIQEACAAEGIRLRPFVLFDPAALVHDLENAVE